MAETFPSVFVSHGAPTLPDEQHAAADFLKNLGRQLGRPEGILVLSAHWETREPFITAAAQPELIYDFYGFPERLYKLQYPARGSQQLAAEAGILLNKAEIHSHLEEARGFDHGTWIPLMLMYPKADIPVVQVSIMPRSGPAGMYEMGQALAPLRSRGVLIVGSGGSVHNLSHWVSGETDTPDWAMEFDDWIAEGIEENRVEDLLNYRGKAPHALTAHPREEHLLPLFAAMGAGGPDATGEVLFRGFVHGSLGMSAFSFS